MAPYASPYRAPCSEGFYLRAGGYGLHTHHSLIYHTLISTSTPEGSSSFISASIVLGVDE